MNLEKISKCFFINLNRRKDRLDHINKTLPFYAQRFRAIEANELELTPQINHLFKKCINKLTKAEIACSLSHYSLWKKLITDKNAENYLILEDDVVFKPGFQNFWNKAFSKNLPEKYNLIYLGGCQPWNKPQYHKVLKPYNQHFYNIKENDFFTKGDHYFHMNAQSYIISKQGASLVCQYVDQLGFDLEQSAADIFIINFFNKNKFFEAPESIFHLYPNMSYQLHEENDNTEIDKKSDLRHTTEKFNNTQNEKTPTALTELLIPLKTNLTKKRIGGKRDGGYVLLKEIFDGSDTVYSYGIDDSENSDSFDLECADQNKRVFMFDGTINRSQSKNPRLIFTKENLTPDNFRSHLLINNNISKNNMILKMDIEGFEYPIIEKNIDLISKCFSMACIEFHGLNNPTFYNFKNKNKILELMLQKYDIFHMHANNWVERKFTVPNVMEISFVRKGFCLNEPDSKYPIKNLDFPNCNNRKDYVLDWWVSDVFHFPNLSKIQQKQIPKKIHLSWKDKNVLNSNYQLIKKGAKNLEILNPEWDIQVYDDEDINRTLRDSIGLENWNLIKDRKITEKTDLWRLIKTYKEGGLYVDIDRYIDTPLSEIIKEKTSIVLPTFQDVDFSQDFILTCAQNPIIGQAIAKNINYRKKGKGLFFLAVQSYMHAVTEILDGKPIDRGSNEKYFNSFRRKVDETDFIETYKETGPDNHILFKNLNNCFDELTFKKDKADFYNQENVIHWNTETEKLHKSFRKQPKNIIWQSIGGINNCYEKDWIMEIFSGIEANHIEDEDMEFATENSIVIYSDMFSHDINRYPKSIHEKWKQIQSKQKKYFDKFKKFQNCILFHLSDEHTQANTSHYKYFKHVFRNYYRKDVDQENVTFIPLGYGRGFNDLTNKTS